ncbi:MAG: hypothetical protein EPO11_09175 [Gammaproteobacteria bacterium]|nr:MAG: hypothetical protein EPO11_09175 [Gammaproteobacteria bacterium]
MRNISITIIISFIFFSTNIFASYDKSWYQWDDWSREYPVGFAVTKKDVVLMGRAEMNKDLAPNIKCPMPYLAVIHPWNKARIKTDDLQFYSFTKIQQLVAIKDFMYEENVPIKKGEVIEYLHYDSEGDFTVRIKGKEYDSGQFLFDYVRDDDGESQEDDWVQVTCLNGKRAYLYLGDLIDEDKDTGLVEGVLSFTPDSYDVVHDLTEKEKSDLERAAAS